MSVLIPYMRTLRSMRTIPKHLTPRQCLPRSATPARSCRCFTAKRTNSTAAPESESDVPKLDPIFLHRLEAERAAVYKRRSIYSGIGFVCGMIAIWFAATSIDLPPKPTKLDARPTDGRQGDALVTIGKEKKIVVQKLGEGPEERVDVVETGTSTVPTFPRVLEFSDGKGDKEVAGVIEEGLAEYQLLGLGIRTVSFLGIQVYVVGMYVATDDIATLQESLIRKINPVATTLVAGEKDNLRNLLLDPEKGEAVWSEVLRDTHARTLIRIVPVRDTDFGHMRDAYVRAVTSRARTNPSEYGDESFGSSVNDLKAVFRKGSVPKKKELLLARNEEGVLAVWYDDGKNGAQRLGDVKDERISRAIWLNYLAGKTVASEPARKSIVDGVMEFVERPIGTVATQVHV